MAKKKSSRASKKNRKGAAAGKASSASTSSRERENTGSRQFQNDGSLPLSSQAVVQNGNRQFQNQSLGSKEQEQLLKKMDAMYNKDLRKWASTVFKMMGTRELHSLGSSMSIISHIFIFQNFYINHCDLIEEKVKATSVKTGLGSTELVVDLNFTRSPPEFEVLPASIFWNREKEQGPANHWFFKDLGRGETHFSDDNIKKIRQFFSFKQEILGLKTLGLDLVFVFLNFGEKPFICAIPSSMESMGRFLESAVDGLKDSSTLVERSNF
ncbi:predicted protein [Chaetoceros tenuissimus]|uniref:Uncharacterized protein n=1 Tax=Chaetoceros tenuissimus TaxID=426638 RepID=A0AAD3CZM9_9STRA|nr:predicted protein [Chaetoceros tenuissimus]